MRTQPTREDRENDTEAGDEIIRRKEMKEKKTFKDENFEKRHLAQEKPQYRGPGILVD